MDTVKVMFVCTGNTCRSAMAVYLAAALAERDHPGRFCFDSAGLFAACGAPASDEAVAAAAAVGIDMRTHRAKPFSPYMVERADLILTMTDGHKQRLLQAAPDAAGKVFTLGEFAGVPGDVRDPWGGSAEEYAATRDALTPLIAAALKKIATEKDSL